MSDQISRLRELLSSAAGDPPGEVTAEAVRRRVARRRVREYLAAGITAVLLAGLGVAVSAASRGAQAPLSGGRLPAGVPRYYVQQGVSQAPPAVTVVRSTVTGTVKATVRCPWGQPGPGGAAPVAAEHETFFMACQKTIRHGTVVSASRVYRFRLTGSGRIGGYDLVPGGSFDGLDVTGLAASATGAEIAAAIVPGGAAGASVAADVAVINTRSGARAMWTASKPVREKVTFPVGDMSLTADGRELVFLASPRCPLGKCRPTGQGEEVRAVSPAARGGRLDSSRVLVRQVTLGSLASSYLDGALITPDGANVDVLDMVSKPRPPFGTTVSVIQVSAATGRPVRVLYRVGTGDGFTFRFFGADPSRRYLLLNVGPASGSLANGWIDDGRLVPLTPADGSNVFYESW